MAEMGIACGAADLDALHAGGSPSRYSTASSLIGCQKLGQPVPDSYLVSESNSGAPQHMQR